MRIGKQDQPYQSICTSDATSITVRGRDLCSQVIGEMDFTSYFWLLLTGVAPTVVQRDITNATLAAITEHGLVPSVVAARMTLAAAPEAFQGAVAAGLLGCGSVVLGSAEAAGDMLGALAASDHSDQAIISAVATLRKDKRPVPGFGHPQHSGGDPRTERLLAVADALGVTGVHVGLLRQIEQRLPDLVGRSLPINVNGAIAAILLDAEFPSHALKGIALLARTAGLIAHLAEERSRPIGFILSGEAAKAIEYQT